MHKLASLLKKRKSSLGTDYDLDVCVQKGEFESLKDAKSEISNTPEQTCIGSICFLDTKGPKEILMDFAFKYKQCLRMGKSEDGEYYFAKYQKQFEPFIMAAFVRYFSRDIKD